MNTNLAGELSKYYSREGNRIIFTNGMTLNQLALEMWDRLGGHAVDPSVISRNLRGERLFTSRQLETFTEVLGLDSEQRLQLQRALATDIHLRYELEPTIPSLYVDVFSRDLEIVRDVMTRGDPRFAVRLATTIATRLKEITRTLDQSSSVKPLYKLHALALFEQGRAYREILPRKQVLPSTKAIVAQITLIGNQCKDEELLALADISLGDAYYITGQHSQSILYFIRSWHKVESVDYRLWTLRQMLLDWAYLDQKAQFEETGTIAKELMLSSPDAKLDTVCAVWEGIARGQGVLGSDKAFYTWDTAWEGYKGLKVQVEQAPFRAVQLLRTRLELLDNLESSNKRLVERTGTEAAHLAKEHGYKRHESYIRKLLRKLLA